VNPVEFAVKQFFDGGGQIDVKGWRKTP
jgi:hypothetical protein